MKIAHNLHSNSPKEIKVFTYDKTTASISNGSNIKLRLKGIRRNF